MPLSESELRTLREMESALADDDPGFADSVDLYSARDRRKRRAGAVFSLGAVIVLLGIAATAVLLGVGVAITVGGLLIMAAAMFVLPPAQRRREGQAL